MVLGLPLMHRIVDFELNDEGSGLFGNVPNTVKNPVAMST